MSSTVLPKIVIGPITRDRAESVGMVNEAFMRGLEASFTFIPHVAVRPKSDAPAARLNAANLYYLLKHLGRWLWCLARYRPHIAHYGITSNWNMEKSLLLLSLARLCGARTVGHLHGGGFLAFWKSMPNWRRRMARRQLNRLTAFVVLSDTWRQHVTREIGLDAKRVFVVNNPIDPDFEVQALQMPIARKGLNILCFGVMDRQKGVLDIVESAALLPRTSGVKYWLVGPDREVGLTAQVQALVAQKQLQHRVEMLGPAFGERKLQLFTDATILLQPSYVENFPLTILEGAAAGLPMIATPIGAVPEFFQHATSMLMVEPGNAKQIAAAIQELEQSAERRHQLASAAREVFLARLQRSRIMDSMQRVYSSVAAAG